MKVQFRPVLPNVSGKKVTDFPHLPETAPSSTFSPIIIVGGVGTTCALNPPPVCKELCPAERLRRIMAAIRAGRALDRDDEHWLVAALDHILIGEPADVALGLKARPGQRRWHTYAALIERDRLFREAAGRFLSGLSLAEQAHRLSVELSRYHATAWQRERACDLCPDRHLGTIREFFWLALKAHDRALSARSLRSLLAAS